METHGLIPNNIDKFTHKGRHHTRRLHGKLSYETPTFSKDCQKYSLYPPIPVWNLLPDCVKTAPNLDKFKANLSNMRPIYIGKNQNPKNLGFLLYRLHCQKNP